MVLSNRPSYVSHLGDLCRVLASLLISQPKQHQIHKRRSLHTNVLSKEHTTIQCQELEPHQETELAFNREKEKIDLNLDSPVATYSGAA